MSAENAKPIPRPIETCPRDGTIVRLLVDYTDGDGALEDSDQPTWTIGFNQQETADDDEWLLAGWNWTHDCFTQGHGTPIGWLPFHGEDSRAIVDVLAERRRQVTVEGWTPEHDDAHTDFSMTKAAIAYAMTAAARIYVTNLRRAVAWWPWAAKWWKPKGRRQDLVRAAALIIAEIERLDRAAERGTPCR
ncbi:hypothetical protein BA190_09195 [Labrys sp. WJW]|uniref:hypothetical protein n=1 Tax=Labrys sp. WJW TaxID=1737983 RepID=UPI0008310532|nr:hypothetical protein [Labrys sp. WJW]OCC05080.1 hypothetical protein BA190_09195 [Labrys sp. WJW]